MQTLISLSTDRQEPHKKETWRAASRLPPKSRPGSPYLTVLTKEADGRTVRQLEATPTPPLSLPALTMLTTGVTLATTEPSAGTQTTLFSYPAATNSGALQVQ